MPLSLGMVDNVETQPLQDAAEPPLPSEPPVIQVQPCPPHVAVKEEVEEQVVEQPGTEVAYPSESGSTPVLEKIKLDFEQAVKECTEVLETTSCENGSAGRLAMRGVQSILLHFLDEYHPEIPLGDTMTQEILEEQKAAEEVKVDPLAKNWKLRKFLAEDCNTSGNDLGNKGNKEENEKDDTPNGVKDARFVSPADQRKIRGRAEAKAKAKAKAKSKAKSRRKSKASKESEVKSRKKSKAEEDESEVKTRKRKSKAEKEESEVKTRKKSKAPNKEAACGSDGSKAKRRHVEKKPATAESDPAAYKKRKLSAMSSAYHVAKSHAAAAGKSVEEQKAAAKLAPSPHYFKITSLPRKIIY